MRIIKSNDKEYRCYEKLDFSVARYQEINESLDFAKKYCLSLMSTLEIDRNLSLKIYTYEAGEVNAFAIRQNEEYCIGISVEAFVELKRWFNTWMSFEKTYKVLDLNYAKKDFLVNYMHKCALMFLVTHECYHVLFGHCDYPGNVGNFLFERLQQVHEDEALFSQSLEMSADCSSVMTCAISLLPEEDAGIIWKQVIKVLFFAVYSVFKLFGEFENQNFEEFLEVDLNKYDHPHAGIRFELIRRKLEETIYSMKEEKNIRDITNEYMIFEKNVLGINNLKELITAIAYTAKGTEQIKAIIEKWSEVRKLLEPYAYIPLMEWGEVGSQPVLIDDKGKLTSYVKVRKLSDN